MSIALSPQSAGGTSPGTDELALVEALRRGDEAAFLALVERYHAPLMRAALAYVGSRAVAEEVVQETWIGVLQGIARFEGRSSLKTWIYRILSNCARSRGAREARSVPFADLGATGDEGPSVDPASFIPPGQVDAGWWSSHPASWAGLPEERFLAAETRAVIEGAVATLPPAQRTVITLRDIEGWPADEVCQLLAISDANQRVLLHRARARVRAALARYLTEG
ncbi:MAG: sigma-70 family RNA polymerase sigma factor [Chloroflexi bacterium OHK40]